MPLSAETPIPLMLEELRSTSAWRLMEERLNKIIEARMKTLVSFPGDASLAEIQRVLGQIEALRMVLREPDQLHTEWRRAINQTSNMRTT